MKNIQQIIDHAQEVCLDNGLRLTKKRRQVLLALLASPKALSAYEIRDVCKTDSGDLLPPMSIYRILEFLQEAGFVHKLNISNRYTACTHITCDHEHLFSQFLICIKCQLVTEINIPDMTITNMRNDAESAGFALESPQLEINGVCYSCKNKAA
tara:strand:- start:488 stop:949 length:462 start_codon:yes stop_codon:yes gene_type:complete